MSMYSTPPDQTVKRHPIRGFFWGLLMGLGITVLLIITNTVAIGTLAPWLVLIFSALFGILWGLFAPPKKAKGAPPYPVQPEAPVEPAAPVETAAAAAAAPQAAPPPVEPMTPEETAASRDTVITPSGPSEHPGTVVDPAPEQTEPETGSTNDDDAI